MKRSAKFAVLIGAVGFAAGAPAAALAQSSDEQRTPKDWSYEIKDGKRVPKGKRTVNPDGSWREVIRQGKCVTTKEKTADGAYKETRRCD